MAKLFVNKLGELKIRDQKRFKVTTPNDKPYDNRRPSYTVIGFFNCDDEETSWMVTTKRV